MMGKRIVAITALVAGTLAIGTAAHAGGTPAQKCASAKQKAAGKKEAAKLGCYSKAVAKALPVDSACLAKADAGFMAAFTKVDPSSPTVCEGTESDVEFTIDHCIDQLNAIINSGICSVTKSQACSQTNPCPTGETCVLKCPAAKLKAAGKAGSAKAGCWAKATGKGLPTGGANPDPTFTACQQKADTGLMNAFTKADGAAPCAGTEGGAGTIVDSGCIQSVMGQLPPVAPGCGNGFVDPDETCDDGATNGHPGDPCPSTCVIQSCTVDSATQAVSIQLTTPPGVTVGALTLFVDYPEGQVRMPVTSDPSNVSDGPVNDVSWGFKDPVIDTTFTDGLPANGTGPMLHVTFHGCQGQPLPTMGSAYNCTITDASDENGTSIDLSTLSCSVTIP